MSVGWVAAGTALVGSFVAADAQKDAASTAADAQTQANDATIANSKEQFAAIQKLLAPYVAAGTGTPVTKFDQAGYDSAMATYQQQLAQWNGQGAVAPTPVAAPRWYSDAERDTWTGAEAKAAAQEEQAYADYLAGKTAPGAAQGAAPVAPTREQFTTETGALQGGSLAAQQDILGLNGNAAQQASIDSIQNSANFQALAQQGENGILSNASATGGLRGGDVQSALAQYRPALLQSLIDQQYNRLSGLTSIGQNAAAGVGNAGLATTNSVNSALTASGAAQASNALAQGGATAGLVNGVSSGIGSLAGSGALNNLFGGTSYSSASPGLNSATQNTTNGYINGGFAGSQWSSGL